MRRRAPSRARRALEVTCALLATSWVAGTARAVESADCLACHAEEEPRVDAKVLEGSVHGPLSCVDCHPEASEIPHSPGVAAAPCGSCHEEAAKALDGSIHGRLEGEKKAQAPTCTTCHGTHDVLPPEDPRSTVARRALDTTCLGCHGDEEIVSKDPRLPSTTFARGYLESVHGQGVHRKGLLVSATCTDCHGNHAILPSIDPRSSTNRDVIPRTCAKCHEGIFMDYEQSTHGMIWKKGRQDGPICTDCHESHTIEPPREGPFRTAIVAECGGCHTEEGDTFADTFHGQATSLGYLVAAKCSDCHTAHRNLPAADPASTVNAANLKSTCGRCHEGANDRFIEYQPHNDPHDPTDSRLVYWVATLMKWLLLGTFAAWGVHTLLWFQRSIVALVRKELTHEGGEERHVRRFKTNVVATHVVIVVSFLGLVATGIPLLYHHTAWAKALGTLLGGVEVARYFHRVFAAATFGYAIYHLVTLARSARQHGVEAVFSGPDSLAPRPKDLTDLRDNIRWFLYLAPPPQWGRFTYFEKFDYFAVFWGIPVIGFSGLLLWFPTFFSKLLPGIFFNVATIVHSDEAMLAAGFIFTFHFFHNHLRPENFPMDLVVFTGRMPLSRFKKERPEEYAALVRDGKLESVLVSPPDSALVWRGRVFGTIALTVGLVLVAAIFLTYLFGR